MGPRQRGSCVRPRLSAPATLRPVARPRGGRWRSADDRAARRDLDRPTFALVKQRDAESFEPWPWVDERDEHLVSLFVWEAKSDQVVVERVAQPCGGWLRARPAKKPSPGANPHG
jgi:hypothetical protein